MYAVGSVLSVPNLFFLFPIDSVRRRVRFAHSAHFFSARNRFKRICKKFGLQKVKLYSIFLNIIPFCYEQNGPLGVPMYAVGSVLSVPNLFFLFPIDSVRRRVRFAHSARFLSARNKFKRICKKFGLQREHKRQSQNFVTAFLRFGLLIIRLFQPQHPTALCSFQL